MKISGIYKIQSKIKPERIYIGSAINIHDRWIRHLWDLKKDVHPSSKLQRHYNKYGKDDLIFSIIIGCDKEDLLNTEQYFLDVYDPFFNTCKFARSVLGIKRSEETKKKLSIANKGQVPYIKGKHRTPEEIAKMRGRKHTEESKEKMRESCKKREPISEETREKLRQSHLGHKISPESLAKRTESFKRTIRVKSLNKLNLITNN